MNIGDIWLRVLADTKDFAADLQKKATGAGDKAGTTIGTSMTSRIKQSFSKGNLSKSLMAGLGFGAGFGAVNALTAAFQGLGTAMSASVEAASDQREAFSLAGQVFENNTAEMKDWAAGAAEAFGQSTTEALNFASGFGTAFKNVGFSLDETSEKSQTLTRLAADLGSAFNASSEEAAIALRSGLLGESEPLRRFGVFLSEAAVKQEAYASGIAAVGSELTNQQKVLARYNIIMRQTADSQGMFGRDTESLADAQKRFGAELENAQAKLGTALIPVMREAVAQGSALLDIVMQLSDAFGAMSDALPAESDDLLRHIADPGKWLDVNGAAEAYLDTLQSFGVDTTEARKAFSDFGFTVEQTAAQIEASADELDIARNLHASFVRSKGAAIAAVGELVTGVKGALDNIEGIVKNAGEAIPLAYADGILEEQSVVKTAMAALINQMETEMSRGEEIAYLIGVLTSEQLMQGLDDKRPGVRARAQETQRVATERLEELLPQGKRIGGKATEALADAMNSKKPKVRSAAKGVEKIIERNIKPNTKPAGRAAVNNLVAQLNAGRGRVGAAAARLAARIISNIVATVRASSGVTRSGPLEREYRAAGGPVEANQAYIVGEKRPELFIPDVPGRIVPNVPPLSEMQPWTGGGTTVNLKTYGLPMKAETPAAVVRRMKRASRLGTVSVKPTPGTWE